MLSQSPLSCFSWRTLPLGSHLPDSCHMANFRCIEVFKAEQLKLVRRNCDSVGKCDKYFQGLPYPVLISATKPALFNLRPIRWRSVSISDISLLNEEVKHPLKFLQSYLTSWVIQIAYLWEAFISLVPSANHVGHTTWTRIELLLTWSVLINVFKKKKKREW